MIVVAEGIPHVDVGILLVGRDAKVGVLHCVLQEIIEKEGWPVAVCISTFNAGAEIEIFSASRESVSRERERVSTRFKKLLEFFKRVLYDGGKPT